MHEKPEVKEEIKMSAQEFVKRVGATTVIEILWSISEPIKDEHGKTVDRDYPSEIVFRFKGDESDVAVTVADLFQINEVKYMEAERMGAEIEIE